jgi:hypothetical protein
MGDARMIRPGCCGIRPRGRDGTAPWCWKARCRACPPPRFPGRTPPPGAHSAAGPACRCKRRSRPPGGAAEPGWSSAVTAMIGMCAVSTPAFRRRVVSQPSISGIWRSIRISLGDVARVSASDPERRWARKTCTESTRRMTKFPAKGRMCFGSTRRRENKPAAASRIRCRRSRSPAVAPRDDAFRRSARRLWPQLYESSTVVRPRRW